MIAHILLAASLAASAQATLVTATGTGATEEAAHRAACVAALRQASGSRVTAVTQVSDMADVWARIAEFSDGYVISSRLLEPPLCERDICKVKLEVEVALAPLETDLARLSEIIGDPAVTVRAADPSEISTQAANSITAQVAQAGLNPSASTSSYATQADDITVLASAEVDCFADMGVSICDLDLEAEIIEATTETILTRLSSRGRGRSVISARDAERKALHEAADNMRAPLRQNLVSTWQDFLKNGQVFRVVYQNRAGVTGSVQIVRDALQLVPGIRGVNERSIGETTAVMDIRFEGLAGELRGFLVRPLAEQGLGVVAMRGRRLDISPLNR